jgi:hypothetical protein
MVGTLPPLPFQLPPLSSSRAKQPGSCSTGTARASVGDFFLGFRVMMQPQTTKAAMAATPSTSCIIGGIVVPSVA